jgi:glycerol-3-phosphate acyltransferase PlsY
MDIRQYGSGNVGITNLLGLTSKQAGIPVIIFDLGKGTVMVWAAQLAGLSIGQQVIVGLAAIMGHNWPVFLRFSGGRGVLTTLGLVLILPLLNNSLPWVVLVFGAIFLFNALIIHNVPLGIGAGIAALPLASWGFGEPLPLTLGYLAMFLILAIRRLTAQHPVRDTSISKNQLLLNRLFFDRDIRDKEAWRHLILEHQKKPGKGLS